MNIFSDPWPWYVGGPLIGLMVPLLLLVGNRQLGISSSLRHICAACAPAQIPFFQYKWRDHLWNLFFIAGIGIGGFLTYLQSPGDYIIEISAQTRFELLALGVTDFSGLVPNDIFSLSAFGSSTGWVFMIIGGFLVGFGTRYAGGCTSGHTIMGLSNLQLSSLVATIGFFVGGLLMTHFLLPIIL
ncbi:MAG: YeeE/YedE thiosulfate transporter family protein [Cyclobacteriaceae bacterium]